MPQRGEIESQIRSTFDFEVAMIASVFAIECGELFPGLEELQRDLESLIEGRI